MNIFLKVATFWSLSKYIEMKEMLGDNNEWGVVTQNEDEALYQSIKRLLDKPDMLQHYKKQAEIRGKDFSTVKTVQAVERLLLRLCEK